MNTPSRGRRALLSFGLVALGGGLATLAAGSAKAELATNKLSANRLGANKLGVNKLGANKIGLNGTSLAGPGTVTEVEAVRLPDGRTMRQ